jgi:hypothetical protein
MAEHEGHKDAMWFPSDTLLAVIDEWEDARQATEELKQAGIGAERVEIWHGDEALEHLTTDCPGCALPKRMLRAVWGYLTLEGNLAQDLEMEAREGRFIMAVTTRSEEDVQKARQVLGRHNVRLMEHFAHGGATAQRHLGP